MGLLKSWRRRDKCRDTRPSEQAGWSQAVSEGGLFVLCLVFLSADAEWACVRELSGPLSPRGFPGFGDVSL